MAAHVRLLARALCARWRASAWLQGPSQGKERGERRKRAGLFPCTVLPSIRRGAKRSFVGDWPLVPMDEAPPSAQRRGGERERESVAQRVPTLVRRGGGVWAGHKQKGGARLASPKTEWGCGMKVPQEAERTCT